jgi:hypothetical protein
MGVAHAFQQYKQVISILAIKLANLCKGCHLLGLQPSATFGSIIFRYSLSTFEFMHYFLEKLIILMIKTEKHPVAMKTCIAHDFFVFIINI